MGSKKFPKIPKGSFTDGGTAITETSTQPFEAPVDEIEGAPAIGACELFSPKALGPSTAQDEVRQPTHARCQPHQRLTFAQNRDVLFLLSTGVPQQGHYLCAKRCESLSILPVKMPQEREPASPLSR